MKLDNFVPLGRPQSGTLIIPVMTELDVTETTIPKPSRKQINALFFLLKVACHNAHNLKIYNRH